jgi:hypothetical protein
MQTPTGYHKFWLFAAFLGTLASDIDRLPEDASTSLTGFAGDDPMRRLIAKRLVIGRIVERQLSGHKF